MSKYTTELRYICEMMSGYPLEEIPLHSVNDIITAARPAIFPFEWGAFNDAWKEKLETLVLKKFYTREIAHETFALWQLQMEVRFNELAMKYNPVIEGLETAGRGLALYYNIDVVSENVRTDNLNMHLAGESRDKYSDTPQGQLSEIDEGKYLSDYRNINSSSNQENTGTQTNRATEKGYRGSKTIDEILKDEITNPIDLLYRFTEEFSDLFFGLW